LTSRFVGPNEIPIFFIKDFSDTITPLLTYIFNHSVLKGSSPSPRRKASDCCEHSEKGKIASAINYKPATILNNSSIFTSTTYDWLYFYFKLKLHLSQHGFIKPKANVTNLLIYVKFVILCAVHENNGHILLVFCSQPSVL
jgi:hypothetical protein